MERKLRLYKNFAGKNTTKPGDDSKSGNDSKKSAAGTAKYNSLVAVSGAGAAVLLHLL